MIVLSKYIKESLLDDEDKLADKDDIMPLMKLANTSNKQDYFKKRRIFLDQFPKIYKKYKIYYRGGKYDLSNIKKDELIIYFDPADDIYIGYRDFTKNAIKIFFPPHGRNEICVSFSAPISTMSLSCIGKGLYILPDTFKDDFEELVKTHQKDRQNKILKESLLDDEEELLDRKNFMSFKEFLKNFKNKPTRKQFLKDIETCGGQKLYHPTYFKATSKEDFVILMDRIDNQVVVGQCDSEKAAVVWGVSSFSGKPMRTRTVKDRAEGAMHYWEAYILPPSYVEDFKNTLKEYNLRFEKDII